MKNIHNSLKNNEIFCGTFFGKNDFYRNNPDISFHTKKQIIKMLDGYEILYFSEVEKECLNYSRKLEHYHSFEFIVKKKYKYRKGSAAIVLNSKNEILLVNLESFEDKYFTVAGGGQDFGETLLNSAHRELKEELNISDEDLEFVGVCKKPLIFNFVKPTMRDGVEYVGSEKFYFGFRFIGEEKNIIPNRGEVRSYKWVKYKDLKNYLLFGSQLLDTQEKIKELFPSFKENQY